jgi:hypothetical protein
VTAVVAAELDSDLCMGINGFADRSEKELSGLLCTQTLMDGEYCWENGLRKFFPRPAGLSVSAHARLRLSGGSFAVVT